MSYLSYYVMYFKRCIFRIYYQLGLGDLVDDDGDDCFDDFFDDFDDDFDDYFYLLISFN